MSTISRSALKGIVKECLVEILQEGIDTDTNRVSLSERKNPSRASTPSRGSALDKIEFGKKPQNPKRQRLQEAKLAQNAAKSITEDPVLASILTDTALTTLQEQSSVERVGPGGTAMASSAAGDTAARQVAGSDPMALFSESATNWAALAFTESSQKG